MADRRVPRDGLHRVDAAFVGAAGQGAFGPAMLIAQRNLQVEDLFAVALEAKMSRLDDAGMDGADGDLVDFLPLDAVIVHDADQRLLSGRAIPGVVAGPIGGVEADRLEPGMAVGPHAVLLGQLALEQMSLRAVGRQRRIAVAGQAGAANAHQARGAVGEDGIQLHRAVGGGRIGEEGR